MNDVTVRDTVWEKFKDDPEESIVEARERRISTGELLQSKCPTRTNSYSHPIASRDFLARDGLRLYPEGRKPSSQLGDFKKPYQKALLGDHLDDVFQLSFSGNCGHRNYVYASHEDRELAEKLQLRESGLAYTAFENLTPFRPSQAGMLEFDTYMSEVPYADLVRSVDVLDGIDTQIPVVDVPKDELLMRETPEGDDPPRVTIGHKTKEATMYRYALTLSLTDMIANSRNSVLISAIEREVMWIGVRYDEMYSYKLANHIMGLDTSATDGTFDAEGILEMQASFSDGRMADRVIGFKTPILRYIAALGQAFGGSRATGTIGYADGVGSEAHRLVAQPTLGNRMLRPERAYYFSDRSRLDDNDWGDDLFWYDSLRTVTRLEYVGGIYDQMSMDAPKALHERTFARWLGYYTQEDAPIARYEVVT